MSNNKLDNFKYEVVDNFDHVIDEKGDKFIAFRRIRWNDRPDTKLDIRAYFSTPTGERMSKGVSFLTDDGPHELAEVLVREGFGDTKKIIEYVAKREGIKLPEVEEDEFYSSDDIISMLGEV